DILCPQNERIEALAKSEGWDYVHPILKGWGMAELKKIMRFMQDRPDATLNLHYVPYSFQKKGLPFQMLWLGAILGLKGIPLYTTFHEVSVRYRWRKPQRIPLAWGQRFIANFLAWVSKGSFTSIGLYHRYFFPFTRRRVRRIPIGSNIPMMPQTDNFRRKLRANFADEGTCLLSFFGRNPRKVGIALETLTQLDEQGVKASLLLIGGFSEEWKDKLKSKASSLGVAERIHFTGYLPAEDIYAHLQATDIYLGMFEEGICLKSGTIAAALGAGLAIVGTHGDMTDPFFHSGENCLLVNELKPEAFTVAIRKIWQSPDALLRISQGARRAFQQDLTWEVTWERYAQTMFNSPLRPVWAPKPQA
ncbi:MAG: glycosyltransferase family 4 protein, partial [Bacteroidota bacterium]